jgi:hypothetical protein
VGHKKDPGAVFVKVVGKNIETTLDGAASLAELEFRIDQPEDLTRHCGVAEFGGPSTLCLSRGSTIRCP